MTVMADGWVRAEEMPKDWEGRPGWQWHYHWVREVRSCIIPTNFNRNIKNCSNMYFKLKESILPPMDWYVWESKMSLQDAKASDHDSVKAHNDTSSAVLEALPDDS